MLDETIKQQLTDSTVTELKLIDKKFNLTVVIELANTLKTNRSLILLDLSINGIDTEGAQAIAEALEKNYSLTSVLISGNEEMYNQILPLLERNKNFFTNQRFKKQKPAPSFFYDGSNSSIMHESSQIVLKNFL